MTTSVRLAGLRRRVEGRMIDAVKIEALNDDAALDRATLVLAAPTTTTIYEGKAQIAPVQLRDSGKAVEFGERQTITHRFHVRVPVTVTGVRVDQVVTITAALNDASLVGVRLRVMDVRRGSFVPDRVILAEEVMHP